MALFNLGKKKEDVKEPTCACNAPVEEAKEESCCCCGGSHQIQKQKAVAVLMQVQAFKISRYLALAVSHAMRCMKIQKRRLKRQALR